MTPTPAPSTFTSALKALMAGLNGITKRSMIIGGVAMVARGMPRFTHDIDATVDAHSTTIPNALQVLKRKKIVPRIPAAASFAATNQVLLLVHQPTLVPIDLSLAWMDFEREALGRAETTKFASVSIRIASPGDLLIYKLVAARPQDQADARHLLALDDGRIDRARVRDTALQLARLLEDEVRVRAIEELLPAVPSSPPKPAARRRRPKPQGGR